MRLLFSFFFFLGRAMTEEEKVKVNRGGGMNEYIFKNRRIKMKKMKSFPFSILNLFHHSGIHPPYHKKKIKK